MKNASFKLKPLKLRKCKNKACDDLFIPLRPMQAACCRGCDISLDRYKKQRCNEKAAKTARPNPSRKVTPAQEEAHYQLVAALPCAECGIEGYSQCAHSNLASDGKGLGLKANYLNTFPLCCTRPGEYGCHAKHDRYIGVTYAEAAERTPRYIADTHQKLGINP